MNFAIRTPFTGLLQAVTSDFRKPDILTFNSRQICSLDQYCRHAIFEE